MTREAAAFVCSHVFKAVRPVLLVARENGDWMFLCGAEHAADEEYQVIGREHMIDRDRTLLDIWGLQDQTEMERTEVGGVWTTRAVTNE